jgi:hypothetical protein
VKIASLKASGLSSEEKIKICSLLIKSYNIPVSCSSESPELNSLNSCYKFLLEHYIEHAGEGFERLIPELIINLFITESIKLSEIKDAVKIIV